MLRRFPPALLLSVAIAFAVQIFRLIRLAAGGELPEFSPSDQLIINGGLFASAVLGVFGALDLADRLSGRAALGARIAALGFAADVAMNFAWVAFEYIAQHSHGDPFPYTLYKLVNICQTATTITIAIGFGLATSRSTLAAGGAVLGFVTTLPWFVAEQIYEALDLGWKTMLALDVATHIGFAFALVWLAGLATRAPVAETIDPTRASTGLAQTSRALWLRLLAAGALAATVLFAAKGARHELYDFVRLITIVAPIINIIALLAFARGVRTVARSGVVDLSRWAFYIALGLALWTAGVLILQTPYLYDVLYGHEENLFGDGGIAERYTTALTTIVPLVSGAAVLLVLVAIARFARRRGLEDLRENASVRTGVFVALVLGAVFIQRYVLVRVDPEAGMYLPILVVIGSLTLFALVTAAKLCTEAAAVIEQDPGLPSARVIR